MNNVKFITFQKRISMEMAFPSGFLFYPSNINTDISIYDKVFPGLLYDINIT